MEEYISLIIPGRSDEDVSQRLPLDQPPSLQAGSIPEEAVGFRVVEGSSSQRYFVGAVSVGRLMFE